MPDEVAMPTAAPDDPLAYRGVRLQVIEWTGAAGPGGGPVVCRDGRPVGSCPPSVETGGREVPWLRVVPGGYTLAGGPDVYFGSAYAFDGRRWMEWFFRLLEAPSPTPDPFLRVSPYPPMAVLDVLELAGEPREGSWRPGCGPKGDQVMIIGDEGWRLNRSTGRFTPIDPDDADCGDD